MFRAFRLILVILFVAGCAGQSQSTAVPTESRPAGQPSSSGTTPNAPLNNSSGSVSSGSAASQPTPHSTQPPSAPFDLSGIWINDEQETVQIHHLSSSGLVLATFTAPDPKWGPAGDCDPSQYAVEHRTKYLDGHLRGTTLTGIMTGCTPQGLVTRCNVTPTGYTAPFTATVSANQITGIVEAEHWQWTGNSGPCSVSKYTANFFLKRAAPTPAATPTASSSTAGGICPPGGQIKTPGDDQALDFVKDGFEKALKDTLDELKDTNLDPMNPKVEELEKRIDNLNAMIGYYQQIKAATCISPDLLQWLQARQNAPDDAARGDACTHVCALTADWLVKIGAISESAKPTVIETCFITCQ